jgi:hypothetical protein
LSIHGPRNIVVSNRKGIVMTLTKRGQTVRAVAVLIIAVIVMGFVGWLESKPIKTIATDEQCNSIYHAVYILEDNPARLPLIGTAWDLGCPFEDENGNHLYTWEAN